MIGFICGIGILNTVGESAMKDTLWAILAGLLTYAIALLLGIYDNGVPAWKTGIICGVAYGVGYIVASLKTARKMD